MKGVLHKCCTRVSAYVNVTAVGRLLGKTNTIISSKEITSKGPNPTRRCVCSINPLRNDTGNCEMNTLLTTENFFAR